MPGFTQEPYIEKFTDMANRCENADQYYLMEEWGKKNLTEGEQRGVIKLLLETAKRVKAFWDYQSQKHIVTIDISTI